MDQQHHSLLTIPEYFSNFNKSCEEESIIHEIHIIKEWSKVQRHLINSMQSLSLKSSYRGRDLLEEAVDSSTQGQAKIRWEVTPQPIEHYQRLTIRLQHHLYGELHLAPGYLVSRLVPSLPQNFADLCAILLALAEHQTLVSSLLKPLQPLEIAESLTPRQTHVLQRMTLGEDETVIAEQLGLSVTTVRTHRQHLYQKLNVSSPQEAILRSFEHRLLDWRDLPYPDSIGKYDQSSLASSTTHQKRK